MQNPVIVIPAITASVLEDRYPINPEEVWTAVLHKEFERVALHPDDVRYEAVEPSRVVARNPFQIVYDDLVEALRHDLTKRKDKPTPVFAFGYDWRRSCFETARNLELMIDEVIGRARLMPHYKQDPPNSVDLVAHSMGGLVAATYLRCKQSGTNPAISQGATKVRRVVTIGTPFRGSVDSILKVSMGMGSLTGTSPRDREREAARMTPSLYQLLPSFPNAVSLTNGGEAVDIFDRVNWQRSILDTMRAYIRQVGAETSAESLLDRFLADARLLSDTVNALDLSGGDVLPDGAAGWLAIVGLDVKTHLRVEVKPGPWFNFVDPENEGSQSPNTGDGTVPFQGASPDFLAHSQLVGVTPSDLSMWEVGDRAMVAAAGFHGTLPNINLVQRLAIRHLRADFDSEVWGTPMPGVVRPQWPRWLKQKS